MPRSLPRSPRTTAAAQLPSPPTDHEHGPLPIPVTVWTAGDRAHADLTDPTTSPRTDDTAAPTSRSTIEPAIQPATPDVRDTYACGGPHPALSLPPGAADRMIATFSRPGELIVALDPEPTLIPAAVNAACRLTAVVTDPRAAEQLIVAAETNSPACRRNQIRLVHTTRTGAVRLMRSRPGAAAAVVLCVENLIASHVDGGPDITAWLGACLRAVRPGGYLIAFTNPEHPHADANSGAASDTHDRIHNSIDDPVDADPAACSMAGPGTVITLARELGWRYLQHIVVAHAVIRRDAFVPVLSAEPCLTPAGCAATGNGLRSQTDGRASWPPVVHRRVHRDAFVFAAPGGPGGDR